MTALADCLNAPPTAEQLEVLRWIAANASEQGPGAVFACLDEQGRPVHGRALQARRSRANALRGELESAGWIDRDERLTRAGGRLAAAPTRREWLEQARRRFGSDPLTFAFVCPSCGHVASVAQFRAAGADPRRAAQECIGRLDPLLGGCDWAAFGLVDICPVHIIGDDGRLVPVFAFEELPSDV